jgi:hypothetical protein
MGYNNVISNDDPQALEKLKVRLKECENLQPFMKRVNAYYKAYGTCRGCEGVSDALAAKLDGEIGKHLWSTQPYDAYTLTNNNAEIKRLRGRIEKLEKVKDGGFSDWEFEGGRAEANADMNRLQLFFDERPDDKRRETLKRHGFRWAPSQGAWQRQLNNNAVYAAGRLDFIKPKDGRTVRDVQLKAPKRNEPDRDSR